MPTPEDPDTPPSSPDPVQGPGAGKDSLTGALEQDVAKEAVPGIRSDKPRFRRWLTIRDDPGCGSLITVGMIEMLCKWSRSM